MFKYANTKEPFLEPILRTFRFNIIKKFLLRNSNKNWSILDFGCGPEAKFYQYINDHHIPFQHYTGYDPLNRTNTINEKYQLTSNQKIFLNKKYDLITMFAVLEHLNFPNPNLSFLSKIIKHNSLLIITTPTLFAKPILEFLSFRLGIISKREIEEHQHYYTFKEIEKLFDPFGFKIICQKYFEFGMNSLTILKNQ